MASNTIKRPLVNRVISVDNVVKTADSNGCIDLSNFDYCAAIVVISPVNAIAIKNGTNKVKIMTASWNGTYNMFVLDEITQGTEVHANVIYY